VVEHISDRVAVMYLGRIVEIASAADLYTTAAAPLHRGAAVGGADPRPDGQAQAHPLQGDVPSPINPPPGCHFHTAARSPESIRIAAFASSRDAARLAGLRGSPKGNP
jgi:ABC-type dipeptide/oligopeptide/nickel transport system ATPase component